MCVCMYVCDLFLCLSVCVSVCMYVCQCVFLCVCLYVCMSVCMHCYVCVVAMVSLIGVVIFARQFYGNVNVSPFGWSFGLTIVGCLFYFFNGILLILHTVNIHRYLSRARYQAAGRTKSTGCLGCLNDCLGAL